MLVHAAGFHATVTLTGLFGRALVQLAVAVTV